MNDLVKFGGGNLPANPDDLVAGLANVSAGLSGRTGGMPIMRLLQDGVYAYGQENIEPQVGSKWAVNPHSFMHGFACWGEGELLGEAMVPVTTPPPRVDELQDFGEPWDQQLSFQMQCLNGEDKGVTVLYKSTAVGFLNAAKQLIDQIVAAIATGTDKYVPVVELEVGHYNHKKYGKTYFPVLDPIEWISIDGAGESTAQAESADEADADDAKAQSTPKGKRRAAAAEPESDPDDKKAADSPGRRRRRRAS